MHKDYRTAAAAVLTAAVVFCMIGYYFGSRSSGAAYSISGGVSNSVYTLTDEEIAAHEALNADTLPDSESSALGIEGRININTADEDTLSLLPGIGKSKASAIVEYREEYGAFTSVDDLLNVPGIGDAIMAQIIDYITVREENIFNEDTGSR